MIIQRAVLVIQRDSPRRVICIIKRTDLIGKTKHFPVTTIQIQANPQVRDQLQYRVRATGKRLAFIPPCLSFFLGNTDGRTTGNLLRSPGNTQIMLVIKRITEQKIKPIRVIVCHLVILLFQLFMSNLLVRQFLHQPGIPDR